MTQTIDDLSIEELQNRLLEIQEKIKEKEKNSLIDQLAQALRQKETAFIQELLELAQGKKAPVAKAPRPEPVEKKPSKFVGKSEVYLRGGKVFYGIQEVKYTRMDRNGILRISKDGKGLPPKVESLPAHIQRLVLALPQKKEVPPAAKGTSAKSTLATLPEAEPVEVIDAAAAVNAPTFAPGKVAVDAPPEYDLNAPLDVPIHATHSEVPEEEPQDAREVPDVTDDVVVVGFALEGGNPLTAPDESTIELVQVELLEATEEQVPVIEPVRKRRPKPDTSPELTDPMDSNSEIRQESAPGAKPKKPDFHTLQGSFF